MKKPIKKIKILRDTREQNPWNFDRFVEYIDISKDTIPYGDYTLVGHEHYKDDNSIIIERKKNTLEIVTNLGTAWDRFKCELEELSKFRYKQIIVCNSCNIEYLYRSGMTKLNPAFFYRQLSSIYINYNIPTLFFDNSSQAEEYVSRLFYQIVKKTEIEDNG